MFKALFFLKRRPGMSVPEFIDYYENVHSKFIKYAPGVRRYFRRYVTPVYLAPLMSAPELAGKDTDFDVLMELWFDDRAAFDAAFANLYSPEVGPMLRADEEKLFDLSKILIMSVEEHETKLGSAV